MPSFDYDLFVIGAGSGGVRAARLAAEAGAKTAIAEQDRVGGTCIIRGCVPKKLLVYASHFGEDFEDARGFGWQAARPRFDWPTLVANKNAEVDRLNRVYIENLNNAGVRLLQTQASLRGPHEVYLEAEGRSVTAETILISTGAWPFKPGGVPGIEHAITSNEAFHLDRLPEKIVIVGGGYIGIEFAGIFNGLGADITLIHRGEEILRPGFDDDLRRLLRQEMGKKGVDIRTQTEVTAITPKGRGYELSLKGGETLEAGLVMYATGRRPQTGKLGLEAAGVETAPNGAVTVDAYSKTSQDSVYAIGDVTNRVNLTPVAIREGIAFVETRFKGNPAAVDHSIVSTAVFSQPALGAVGLTEAQAREKHGEVTIYKSAFRPMKHTLSGRNEQTMFKMVVEPESDKILGIHILGPDSGELIQLIGIAVTMGATKAQFDATIAVHPTASEELVTMG